MKNKRTRNKKRKCISCGGPNLISANGKIVCEDCGVIQVENRIDHGPEWRSFDGQESSEIRVKMRRDPLRHDKGMYTYVGKDKKDARGKKFSAKRKKANRTIRRWQNIINTDNRTLQTGFYELKRISSQLYISNLIRNSAAEIFEEAVEKKLTKHYEIITNVAASLYLACQQFEQPRTFAEISKQSETDEKAIAAAYRLIKNSLKIKISSTSPLDLIPRFCSKLNLDQEVVNISIKMMKQIQDDKILLGKNPLGITAAIIYLSSNYCNIDLSQRKIGQILNITEPTIRNRVSDIKKLIPNFIEHLK